jgi:gliding motility-associated-like protein
MHHEYQLKFYYNANTEYKELLKSSSLFLQVNPGDRKNILTVSSNTSWTNKKYKIYRKQGTSNFSLIATVTDDSFTDLNLNNNETYCYIVESEGSYNIKNIEDPLYNFSQEVCSTPNDNEPPCNQELAIVTICDKENISQDKLYNELNWKKNTSCTKEEIPLRYNIYYKSTVVSDFELVLSTDKTTVQHLPGENNISGCYIITALDINGNESEPSNEVCIENCPIYDLPNTFTPNGDGDNELFKPIKNFFIASVNFELFNEWGVKVFETTDPAINWNGKTKSGNDIAEGTYYYVCNVLVNTIEGTSNLKKLKGYINIIR